MNGGIKLQHIVALLRLRVCSTLGERYRGSLSIRRRPCVPIIGCMEQDKGTLEQ